MKPFVFLFALLVFSFSFSSALAFNETAFCERLGIDLNQTYGYLECQDFWSKVNNNSITNTTIYTNQSINQTINESVFDDYFEGYYSGLEAYLEDLVENSTFTINNTLVDCSQCNNTYQRVIDDTAVTEAQAKRDHEYRLKELEILGSNKSIIDSYTKAEVDSKISDLLDRLPPIASLTASNSKRGEFSNYLPYVLIGIVLVVVVYFFYFKKKKGLPALQYNPASFKEVSSHEHAPDSPALL
jgi:hypothetical protein